MSDVTSSLDVADYIDPPGRSCQRTTTTRGDRLTLAQLPDGGREFGYVIDAAGSLLVLDTVRVGAPRMSNAQDDLERNSYPSVIVAPTA